ncbi:unnamed protein product, partial [Didymodactylos carnosus]
WIGFGVPQWQELRQNGSTDVEHYGLWSYCQTQEVSFKVCQRWPTAEKQLYTDARRPQFVRTAEGLVTTGMILLTLGLLVAIVAALLPRLVFLATVLAFIAFILLVVAIPVFARQANNFSRRRGDVHYSHRYGFWLFIPVIILEFLSFLSWLLSGVFYELYGYGTIATRLYYAAASPYYSYGYAGLQQSPSQMYYPQRPQSLMFGPQRLQSQMFGPQRLQSQMFGPQRSQSLMFGPQRSQSLIFSPQRSQSLIYGLQQPPSIIYNSYQPSIVRATQIRLSTPQTIFIRPI